MFFNFDQGGITGAFDICITMPTELIKTKMQLYPEFSKKGVLATVKDTVAKRGIPGIYNIKLCDYF